MTKKFLNKELNKWVEFKSDDTKTENHIYNEKIDHIKWALKSHGWIVERHEPNHWKPDMVAHVSAWLETPLKVYSYESDLPCRLSISYKRVPSTSAEYWIQTASNEWMNDVNIWQPDAVNGSTDLIQSVTEQMKNNFYWFCVNKDNFLKKLKEIKKGVNND